MKLALLLSGISLEINKHWQYGTSYSVDYNNSYENYQKYIFEYFKNKFIKDLNNVVYKISI